MEPSSPSRKACCADDRNVTVVVSRSSTTVQSTHGEHVADLVTRRCAQCGAQHHELTVDPIPLLVTTA